MTDLIQNKMVFWDTLFFFSIPEMNELETQGSTAPPMACIS